MFYDHKAVIEDLKNRGHAESFDGEELAGMLTAGHLDANKFDSINFVGKEVSYDDIVKSANMDLMAGSGVFSAMRMGGSVAIAAAPTLGKIVGAAAYLGAEGFSLASALLRSRDNTEFWEDYYKKIGEVSKGNSFLQGAVQGGNIFMGSATPSQLDEKKNEWAFVGGNMLGYLGRDITLAVAGTHLGGSLFHKLKKVGELKTAMASAEGAQKTMMMQKLISLEKGLEKAGELGLKVGIVGGSASANALNKYTTERGNGKDTVAAIRHAISIGAATSLSLNI